MSTTKEEPTNQRKQAFYDSHNSYKINVDKYKNISDPILQQKERYVSNIYLILFFNRKQKNTSHVLNQIITSKKGT